MLKVSKEPRIYNLAMDDFESDLDFLLEYLLIPKRAEEDKEKGDSEA